MAQMLRENSPTFLVPTETDWDGIGEKPQTFADFGSDPSTWFRSGQRLGGAVFETPGVAYVRLTPEINHRHLP